MGASRRVQLFAKNPDTGELQEVLTDGSGKLQVAGDGGGGGGGTVAQGNGAADASSPWYAKIVDGAGALIDFATETTIGAISTSVEQIKTYVASLNTNAAQNTTLAEVRDRFLSAVALSSTVADSITSTIVGAALLARDENNSRFLRVSIDPNNRALNVRSYPRSVNTIRGSNNGTGTTAAWGRHLSVAGFGSSLARVACSNKSASAAWLFILDKSTAIAAGELPSFAPRLVPAGSHVDLVLALPDSGTSNGLQLGLSTTQDRYFEIGADDAFFECSSF